MDLALLFDLVLREFETPMLKWTDEKGWNNLVRQSQDFWWPDYWQQMSQYLNKQSKPTFHQAIYGKE
jgi:hypothetical protein